MSLYLAANHACDILHAKLYLYTTCQLVQMCHSSVTDHICTIKLIVNRTKTVKELTQCLQCHHTLYVRTTQYNRKQWERRHGKKDRQPTTEPWTCDLCSIVEFYVVTQAQESAMLLRPTLPLMCLGNSHKSNIWFHHFTIWFHILMKSKYLASDFREEAHNHTIYIFGWTYFFNRLYTVLTPHPATTSFLLVHLTPSYYGSYTTLSITAHHLTLHTHLTALFKGQL